MCKIMIRCPFRIHNSVIADPYLQMLTIGNTKQLNIIIEIQFFKGARIASEKVLLEREPE